MSALVIGSVTPDFEYFIKMKLSGRYSHSIEGMFLMDLPIACVIVIVFHGVVKKPLIDNLPNYFYERLIRLRNFDFLDHMRKHFISVISCVLIGIASHILWDSFTHANAFEVRLPFLSQQVYIPGVFKVPLFRILQHVSTAIGAGFILLVFHRLPRQQKRNFPRIKFWSICFVIASIAFMLRSMIGFEYLGDIVSSVISAGILGLIVASLFSRAKGKPVS
jgi:hypothetical protein